MLSGGACPEAHDLAHGPVGAGGAVDPAAPLAAPEALAPALLEAPETLLHCLCFIFKCACVGRKLLSTPLLPGGVGLLPTRPTPDSGMPGGMPCLQRPWWTKA